MKNLLLAFCVLITSISLAQREIEVFVCHQNLQDSTSAILEIEILNDSSVTIIYSTYRCPGCYKGDLSKSNKRDHFLSYGVYNKSNNSILSKSIIKQMQNTYYIEGVYVIDHDDIYNEIIKFTIVKHYYKGLNPTIDMEESKYYD